MKFILLFVYYISTMVFFYLFLSLIGLLWYSSYFSIITNKDWSSMYFVFLGWWLPLFDCSNLYTKYIKKPEYSYIDKNGYYWAQKVYDREFSKFLVTAYPNQILTLPEFEYIARVYYKNL